MKGLKVPSRLGDYSVYFEDNFSFLNKLAGIAHHILIVDKNIHRLYGPHLAEHFTKDNIFLFEASEENKTLRLAARMYEELMKRGAKRATTMISIGGGITQDVTGFVASTYFRGIPWIYVPTTLLAQTDSCVGSKTSLNFKGVKNVIGTFYPPKEIYICPRFLKTLSRVDFYSGLGEVIKFQLMKEEYPKDLAKLAVVVDKAKAHRDGILGVIQEGLAIKISYFSGDEFDFGRRSLLNYGHCFGHALEAASHYTIPHGIAIMAGMIFANRISLNRSLISGARFEEVNERLLLPHIALKIKSEYFDRDALLKAMQSDKKRTGKELTMIVPGRDFRLIKATDVREEEFDAALKDLKTILKNRTFREEASR